MRTAFINFRRLLSESDKNHLIFSAFILFLIGHHLFVFLGFYDMDDINYARFAANILDPQNTVTHPADHLSLRWVTIYVTAVFYGLFGINEFSSFLFSFLCLAFCGFLIVKVLSKYRSSIVITALILFLLNYSVIFYTHRLTPDPAACLIAFSSYIVYDKYASARSFFPGALFALLLFLFLLTKETIILFLPLVLFLFIRDILNGSKKKFWMTAIVISAVLLSCYLFYFKLSYGDWFHRYSVLKSASYLNACSYHLLPFANTLRRISYELWRSFLLNGDLILLIAGFCGYIYRSRIMPDKTMKNLSVAFFILLLSANFMTFSFTAYVPLCPDPRHFIFLYPFAAVSGGHMINAYFKNARKYLLLPVLVIASTITIFLIPGGEIKYIYLLVSIVLLLPLVLQFLKSRFAGPQLFTALLAICFMIRPLYDLKINRYAYFHDHKSAVNFISTNLHDAYIFTTNDLTAEISEYFQDFKKTPVKFQNITRFENRSQLTGENSFFLFNRSAAPEAAAIFDNANFHADDIAYKSGPVILYRIRSVKLFEYLQTNFRTPVSGVSLSR